MHKAVILYTIFFLSLQKSFAQSYDSEFILGGGMHTRGFLITGEYSLIKDENKNISFRLEFAEIKSPKEKRITSERRAVGGTTSRSYIYGKQNNLYALRMAAGQRFYISEKTDKSVIAIAFSYSGGISLGMLKPYYLDLIYRIDPSGIRISSEKYSKDNELKFLDPTDISGHSGFGRGWDELTLAPGLYGKGSLIFDWGATDDFAKILELGLTTDIYFRNMPIGVREVRPPVFLNLFMNFYFGTRW
jgi:hypothetical protein